MNAATEHRHNMDRLPLQRFRCGHICAAPVDRAIHPRLSRDCLRLLTANRVEERDMLCWDCRQARGGEHTVFGAMPRRLGDPMTWAELCRHPEVRASFESGKAVEL